MHDEFINYHVITSHLIEHYKYSDGLVTTLSDYVEREEKLMKSLSYFKELGII